MCSDPQEITNKQTGEVVTVACRRCDPCIATRRHGWVARAMAEKTGWPHTLCICLTYSDETQQGRDGARMFCYADVRAFLGRVRRACRYEAEKLRLNQMPQIRFLVAGEQGDENGRCHWHLIIYSDFDLTKLGTVMGLKNWRKVQLTERADMLTVGKNEKRLNWSLWPHGFCTFQEADQGGMNYVLSYCLKDQFTAEKSFGTMRYDKAENFATGLFRMSKRPAIGEDWIYRRLETLLEKGACFPHLNLKVPDLSGYWHPNGTIREKLLWGLVALNKRREWATGAPAPQWSSLLASCAESEKDMEILNGVEEQEEDPQTEAATFARQQRETGGFQARSEFRKSCGSLLPCGGCLSGVTSAWLDQHGIDYQASADGSGWQSISAGALALGQRTALGSLNPFCAKRGSQEARHAYPRSGA